MLRDLFDPNKLEVSGTYSYMRGGVLSNKGGVRNNLGGVRNSAPGRETSLAFPLDNLFVAPEYAVMPIPKLDLTSDSVNAEPFPIDGRYLACASRDKPVKLWSISSGEVCHTFTFPLRSCVVIALSPDGKLLSCGYAREQVVVFDVASGKVSSTSKGPFSNAYSVALSPDGRLLASGLRDVIRLLDVAPNTTRRSFERSGQGVLHVAFSPDGQTLAAAVDFWPVNRWNLRTGLRQSLSAQHGNFDIDAFSPDN
jgi:WD40 repeat protein